MPFAVKPHTLILPVVVPQALGLTLLPVVFVIDGQQVVIVTVTAVVAEPDVPE